MRTTSSEKLIQTTTELAALSTLPYDATLITPFDLGTRVDPHSGKTSTIDISFSPSLLAINAQITFGLDLGSAHLLILVTLYASPTPSAGRSPNWMLDERKWDAWNKDLSKFLCENNFPLIVDPTAS